jgi:hypothetical protein
LEAYFLKNAMGDKKQMVPARIKLRPFIGEELYLTLITKVVEFNEGIDLKNHGSLDSLHGISPNAAYQPIEAKGFP